MSELKKLAGQTAIYGLPSILGRFLNYALFPLYTAVFVPAIYGVVNDIYALVAFVAVVLPWGMETAFFRFSNKSEYSPDEVFRTSLLFVGISSLLFLSAIFLFTDSIAAWIGYPDNPEYILWMGLTLGLDALSVIPLAQLRNKGKALKFAGINLISIFTNISLNLFFIWYCMSVYDEGGNWITDSLFVPAIGVGYIFLSNLAQAGIKFVLLSPTYRYLSLNIHWGLLKKLVGYASPLVLAGFAGIINETLDRRLIRIILEPKHGTEYALAQVGIYGAVYKLAILISLFTQAFRYAAEPYFFSIHKDSNGNTVYAEVMKWYTIIVTLLLLTVLLYLDVFKLLLRNEAYWVGLNVVPILLMANIFLGWIYNLSVWYKMTHKTIYGAYLAVIGAAITIGMNYWLIPILGFTGAAWATFAAYGVMAIISYLWGRKYFPVPYAIFKIVGYPLLAFAIYFASLYTYPEDSLWATIGINTIWGLVFLAVLFAMERKSIQSMLRKR